MLTKLYEYMSRACQTVKAWLQLLCVCVTTTLSYASYRDCVIYLLVCIIYSFNHFTLLDMLLVLIFAICALTFFGVVATLFLFTLLLELLWHHCACPGELKYLQHELRRFLRN